MVCSDGEYQRGSGSRSVRKLGIRCLMAAEGVALVTNFARLMRTREVFALARILVWLYMESQDFTVEWMCENIGVPCDVSWRKGDQRGRTSKVFMTNSWKLESSVEVGEFCDEVPEQVNKSLNEVLDRMSGHEDRFRSVASLGESGILIGITASYVPAIILNASTLSRISALGVDVEIDLILAGEATEVQEELEDQPDSARTGIH